MYAGDYKHSEQTFKEISFLCNHCTSSTLLDSPAKHIKNWHNKDQNSMKTTTDVRCVTLSTWFLTQVATSLLIYTNLIYCKV